VTESNVPNLRDVDQTRDLVAQHWKHPAKSGMKEQWFVIPNQEMAELEVDLWNENGYPEHIFCDFCCTYHAPPPLSANQSGLRPRESQDSMIPDCAIHVLLTTK
jgi:hypothetical protein